MENLLSSKERRRLQKVIMQAIGNEIRDLPSELQYLLTDDLVTALRNRITVFQRIQLHSTSDGSLGTE